LVIDEEQAENVRLIFDLYLSGQSFLGIIKELEKEKFSLQLEKRNGIRELLMLC